MVAPQSIRDVLIRALYMTPQPEIISFLTNEVQNFVSNHLSIAQDKMSRISSVQEANQILEEFKKSIEGGVQ
jgi:hypothetical protein